MHCLIIGKTLSGKTTWAKKKAQSLKKITGRYNLVLDPFLDPDFNADFITYNQEEFLQVVWSNRSCNLFIDEAGDTAGKYSHAMNEIATRGRHFGHKAFFICQRAKMVSTTIRTQCSDLVVFKQAYADVKDLANEFVEPIILDADKLEDGEFIYIRKGYKPIKSNVFGM